MKKITAFVLTILLAFTLPINTYAAHLDENDKNVNCKSAILMCADTGQVLYEKNAYEHLSPASLTKILALLVIAEHLENGAINLTDIVSASENAVAMGGSQIWLEVGEQMSVEELLKATIIASANDAVTALGECVAGSNTEFVKLVNDRAKELGLENTNFENCTGLDDTTLNHYSCAYDLAVISRELIKYNIVTKYSTTWLDSLRNGQTELNNTNKLVNKYNGITGLKTGTTSNAGFCLSATAKRDNMNLIAVVLDAPTSKDRFDSASYLLDWGFANYELKDIEIEDSYLTPIKVKNGIEKSMIPGALNSESVLIEKGHNDFTYEYNIPDQVVAPIYENDIIGNITIKCEDKEIGKIDLKADRTIKKVTFIDILLTLFKKM